MAKEKLNNKKALGTIILSALLGGFICVLVPIVLAVMLGVLFPATDAYLLTGFSFFALGAIVMVVIPVFLLILISVKSKKKGVIKRFCKDYKGFVLMIVLPLVIIEIALAGGGYTYFKDIKEGSQEAIMTDAVVERRASGKSSRNTYLIGEIDGEKTRLELSGDARDAVSRGENYERLKIKYYKNIAEVFEIDVIN
ncbi:MAG: hypothetical protein IJ409_09345 [Lachnospiraceae bacterium]|nr:hypothetical protein [Lachnospiraceae bacterium]